VLHLARPDLANCRFQLFECYEQRHGQQEEIPALTIFCLWHMMCQTKFCVINSHTSPLLIEPENVEALKFSAIEVLKN
jgi:hypothetical protein